MTDHQQQILAAFGLDDMTPTEQAAWDAYGRAVEARGRSEEAFGKWVQQRYATAQTELDEMLRAAVASDD